MFNLDLFLNLLNVTPKRSSSRRVMLSCPLAPWTHSKGKDEHPSANISTHFKLPLFKCFTCNFGGNIIQLARKYQELSGNSRPLEYVKEAFGSESHVQNLSYEEIVKQRASSAAARLRRIHAKEKAQISKPQILERFLKEVPLYAKERGLSFDEVNKWEIGFDSHKNRMTFAIRDYLGTLAGFSGRALSDDDKPKYYHYPGLEKNHVLYGENFLDRNHRTVHIVEGFFDVIVLTRMGVKNVVATMGTSLSEHNLRNLSRWFTELVFIPDGDAEGLKFCEIAAAQCLVKIRKVGIAGVIKNVSYEKRKRPIDWTPSDFMFQLTWPLDGKDPSDLSKEELDDVFSKTNWLELRDL